MKNILKNIIYFLYNILSFSDNNKAVVLMYHSISDNGVFFAVKKEDFLKQIEYIAKKKYNTVSLDKLYDYIKNKNIPPRTIAITFDDGYRDNYLNALPILKKYNISAAIFLTTSLMEGSAKTRNGENLEMLNYDEIKEMQNSGLINFESHCQNHKKLARLAEKEVENELLLPKEIIREKINYEVKFLAYPFGSFNEKVKNIAKKYYKMAFTVKKGKINCNSDLFDLKRNSIDSEISFFQFKNIIKNGRI